MKKVVLFLLITGILALLSGKWLRTEHLTRVRAVKLEMSPIQELVISKAAATVHANKTATLGARQQGKVVKVFFRENSKIKAGDTVVALDTENLHAQKQKTLHDIVSAQRKIEQNEINIKRLQKELQRSRPLIEKAISQSYLDNLEKDMEMAQKEREVLESTLHSLHSSRAILDVQLKDAMITAPFDGVLVSLLSEDGESVIPGTPLFSMIDADEPLIYTPIDEADISRIAIGQRTEVKFDTTPDMKYRGKVCEIYKIASVEKRNERTITVKVKLERIPEFVRVGMSANVEIIVHEKARAPTLPTHVVYEDRHDNRKFVYTIKEGIIARQAVKTGLWNWDITEIVEGVSPTDVVVYSVEETGLKAGIKAEIVDD